MPYLSSKIATTVRIRLNIFIYALNTDWMLLYNATHHSTVIYLQLSDHRYLFHSPSQYLCVDPFFPRCVCVCVCVALSILNFLSSFVQYSQTVCTVVLGLQRHTTTRSYRIMLGTQFHYEIQSTVNRWNQIKPTTLERAASLLQHFKWYSLSFFHLW